MKFRFLVSIFSFLALEALAQSQMKHGLDSVFVEVYYIADAQDALDSASGDPIPEGAVTYRIFLDMAEGYKLQMLFAPPESHIEFSTTTKFYNNQFAGRLVGADMAAAKLKRNIMALDSWITLGAASNMHYGTPKASDSDGSIVGGDNNDGGSQKVAGGLLTNSDEAMGIPLVEADGLVSLSEEPTIQPYYFKVEKKQLVALDLADNDGKVVLRDIGMAILEGITGPNPENQVLIAQLTTDGELSFRLNFQLIAPYGGVERFIAENPDPIDFTHPSLIQTVPKLLRPISLKAD